MNSETIASRQQACFYLGVPETATADEIKRAYHRMAKQYHPDANPSVDTREYYLCIQKAYRYLQEHPYLIIPQQPMPAGSRPVRIFQTDAQVRERYRRQKKSQEERQNARKREAASRQRPPQAAPVREAARSKEEEALDKIRTIWLAEGIRRQLEHDREQKQAEQRRRLYQAFMQHERNSVHDDAPQDDEEW